MASSSSSSPPPPTTTRWALRLSLLAGAVAVAVALTLQHHIPPLQQLHQLVGLQAVADEPPVETYCYRGGVRTSAAADGAEVAADCFSVRDGRFAAVFRRAHHGGDDDDDGGGGGGVVPLRPGYVLPGLWDGHGHLIQYGEFLHSADLFGASGPDDVRARLREYLRRNPAVGSREVWARGIGWDQMALGSMPTAAGDFLIFFFFSFFFLVEVDVLTRFRLGYARGG